MERAGADGASLDGVQIAVVGSLNVDTTMRVERHPAPGETVLAAGHFTDTGGKGANQAVAAARLGHRVAMIGMVGDDPTGDLLRRTLSDEGVDVSGVGTAVGIESGMAVITVDASGENTIVVDPAANAAVTAYHVARFASVLRGAAVTLAQLEIPIEAVAAAARLAGGRFVLNPAPAATVPAEVMARVSVLVPNRNEVTRITGGALPQTPEEAMAVAGEIAGPEAVVVTLGSAGAVIVSGRFRRHVPAPGVTVVDPTAAGDAFCGGLAGALADGASLDDAVRWAVRCGAVATTRWGAQSSLPSRSDVEALEGS